MNDTDIVGYLLGELGPDERRRMEEALGRDPALRAEVERMSAIVGELETMPAEVWEPGPVPPLPGLPERGRAPGARAALRRLVPARLTLPPLAAAAAALALLAAGVGIGVLAAGDGEPAPAGPAVALRPIGGEAPSASGEALVVASDGGGLRLRVDGLPPSAQGEHYELWLLDGPDRLLSLGAFRVPPEGATEVTVPLPVPLTAFDFVDVSVEPEDGDPSHSGRSVLRGATSA